MSRLVGIIISGLVAVTGLVFTGWLIKQGLQMLPADGQTQRPAASVPEA